MIIDEVKNYDIGLNCDNLHSPNDLTLPERCRKTVKRNHLKTSPNDVWYCTLRKGHGGNHHGHGDVGCLCIWKNEDKEKGFKRIKK